jgi:hypothetical protein
MKQFYLLIAAALFSFQMNAQKISKDNVPAVVIEAFKAKFSIAEKTTWELDYDKYQAEFSVGKANFSAKFDKDGKWLETKTYIKPSDLPKNIRDAVAKKYGELSAYKIEEAEKVERGKQITYELEVKKGEGSYELEFDEEGEVLTEEKKSETRKD